MERTTQRPLVSVIVPVYNAENYIETCIGSLLQQTLENIEIIAVDDGSKDNSLQLLYALMKKDSRVKVLHQDNAGVSSARNAGLAVACGEYIGFVDADDWVEQDMCAVLYQKATEEKADIVSFGRVKGESEKEIPQFPDGVFSGESLKNTVFPLLICNLDEVSGKRTLSGSVYTKLFSADFLQKYNLKFKNGLAYNEDYLFSIEATLKCGCYVYYGSQNPYHVRRNIISATKRYYPNYWDRIKCALESAQKLCQDNLSLFQPQLNKYAFEIAVAAFRNEIRRLEWKTAGSVMKTIKGIMQDPLLKSTGKKIDGSLLFKTNRLYLAAVNYKLVILALALAYRDESATMKELKG